MLEQKNNNQKTKKHLRLQQQEARGIGETGQCVWIHTRQPLFCLILEQRLACDLLCSRWRAGDPRAWLFQAVAPGHSAFGSAGWCRHEGPVVEVPRMGSSCRERLLGVPGAVSSSVRQLLTPAEATGGNSPVAVAAPKLFVHMFGSEGSRAAGWRSLRALIRICQTARRRDKVRGSSGSEAEHV